MTPLTADTKKMDSWTAEVQQHQTTGNTTPCPEKKEATLFLTTTLAFLGRFL